MNTVAEKKPRLTTSAMIASIAGEVVPSREFYDYEAKYMDEASGLVIPAPILAETLTLAQDYAVRAFKAIDAAGLARGFFA